MSGIDWSQIGSIPAPKVIGTVPGNPGNSSLSSLADGLMSGAKTGSDLATQAQDRQQSQALFPAQLQNAQAIAKVNAIKAQQAQDSYNASTKVGTAFQQSWSAGMDQMAKTDPAGKARLDNTIADTKDKLTKAAQTTAETEAGAKKLSDQTAVQFGNLVNTAQKAQIATGDPKQAEAVYEQGRAIIAKTAPELAELLPPTFSKQTYMTFTYLGGSAADEMKTAELTKVKADPFVQQLNMRDNLQGKVQNGTATDQDRQDLVDITKKIHASGTNLNPNDPALKEDQKILDTQTDKMQTTSMLIRDTQDLHDVAAKVPPGYTGPLMDFFKANKMNSEIMKMTKLQADIPLLYRNLVGMNKGVGRFTNAILDQIKTATGTTALNMDAIQWVTDRVHDVAIEENNDSYKQIDSIRGLGDPDRYKAWQKVNPPPTFNKFENSAYQPNPISGSTAGQPSKLQPSGGQPSGQIPAASIPQGRVAVQNLKTGQIGHIPQSQIQQALASGYKLLNQPSPGQSPQVGQSGQSSGQMQPQQSQ